MSEILIVTERLVETAKAGFHMVNKGGSCIIEWCPGNGTKYRVLFNQISRQVAERIGANPESVLVTEYYEGRGISFPKSMDSPLLNDFAEKKWNLSRDRLWAFCCIVNWALDLDEKYGQKCYEEVMRYK